MSIFSVFPREEESEGERERERESSLRVSERGKWMNLEVILSVFASIEF